MLSAQLPLLTHLLLVLRLWLHPCEWPMPMSVVAPAIAGVPESGATPVDTLCQRTRGAAEGDWTAGRLSASAAAVDGPAALWLLATHGAPGEAAGADGKAQTGGQSINESVFYFMSVHIKVILDKNKKQKHIIYTNFPTGLWTIDLTILVITSVLYKISLTLL